MKKILFITILLYTTNATALQTNMCIFSTAANPCNPDGQDEYLCTTDDGSGCPQEYYDCTGRPPKTTIKNGVQEITKYIWQQGCNKNMCLCALNDISTYECAPGYYGSATNFLSHTCTKCPENATCLGGNNSTFICPSGTLKTQDACNACPEHATCNGSTTFTCRTNFTKNLDTGTCTCDGFITGTGTNITCNKNCPENATCKDGKITCNQNYYLDNDSCLACPYNGLTNGNGQTLKTKCYIPADREIKLINGTGHFEADCKIE